MKSVRLILSVLAVMSMAACSKGTEDAIPESGFNNGSGNGGGLGSTTKYVKSIILGEYEDGDYYEGEEWILSYDSSNRLSEMIVVWDWDDIDDSGICRYKYAYGLDKVISTYEDIDDNFTCAYYFTGGLLVKEQWDTDGGIEYLYQNGAEHPYKGIDIDDYSLTNISWSPAGNLVSYETDYYSYTFTYTDYRNKLNVDLINWYTGLFSEGFMMDSAVFKSVVSTYLPSKMVYENVYGKYYEERFTYKFDSEGYPTEIKIADADGNWYMIFKITY